MKIITYKINLFIRKTIPWLKKIHIYFLGRPVFPKTWKAISVAVLEITGLALSFFLIEPYLFQQFDVAPTSLVGLAAAGILIIANTCYFVLRGFIEDITGKEITFSRYFILLSLSAPLWLYIAAKRYWSNSNNLKNYLLKVAKR